MSKLFRIFQDFVKPQNVFRLNQFLESIEKDNSALFNSLATHAHDDRYYIESEIDDALKAKADKGIWGALNG